MVPCLSVTTVGSVMRSLGQAPTDKEPRDIIHNVDGKCDLDLRPLRFTLKWLDGKLVQIEKNKTTLNSLLLVYFVSMSNMVSLAAC